MVRDLGEFIGQGLQFKEHVDEMDKKADSEIHPCQI